VKHNQLEEKKDVVLKIRTSEDTDVKSFRFRGVDGGTQRNAVPVGVFTGGTPFRLFLREEP
jgi:hypothetical protein